VGRTIQSADQTVLGTAQSFAVLGASTVTNTGATTVGGNLGVGPGLAVTGFPPGLVAGGTIHAGDAVAQQAQSDTTTAYIALAGEAPTVDLTGQDLGASDWFTHLACGGQSQGGFRLSNREHAYNRKQLVGARHQRSTRLQHFLASGELGDPRDDDRVQGKYSRAHERHAKY
jgi:hypothetical protein